MYGCSDVLAVLTSVFGGDMQNWMSPIFAFSVRDTPPAWWATLCSSTRPSTSSVSSTVPLGGRGGGSTSVECGKLG